MFWLVGTQVTVTQKTMLSKWFEDNRIPLSDETFNILNEIGVEAPVDLKDLDSEDIENICSTLKKVTKDI